MKEKNHKLHWELGNLKEEVGKCKRVQIRGFQRVPVSELRVIVGNDMPGREGRERGQQSYE